MLVSLNWLRDYVDLPADLDVDDLAHRLTMASAEVEGIHRVGAWDRDLVRVGHVLAVEPHPDADRLRLVTVDYGGEAPMRVVCGAPNVAQGQRIAFAREGADLIDGHTGKPSRLKRGTIRGVVSAGMVLSEMELGLSQEHAGIIVLPEGTPIGTPVADVLGDTILDVHVWPNRADTMNLVGIAREIAAILGGARSQEVAAGLGIPGDIASAIIGHVAAATGLFGMPMLREPDETYVEAGPAIAGALDVRIENPTLCARYIATLIEGVRVGPSPEWMQERLRAAGMRPINNVVDITNYVMLELGQPLHAFDADRVQGAVGVRLARPGEALRTLDGVDRALTPDTLLITDDSGPIALAGVMGGASTEVTEGTTRVLLEAARFDPVSIRRTSFRLALRSEASSRFERGLSPELAAHASRRATKLFVELCGGTARQGNVDAYPAPLAPAEVTLTRARLDTLIGVHVPTAEVAAILRTLGFTFLESDGGRADGAFRVRAPWWRTDIAIPDDLAEEVVRLAGYDRLPPAAIEGAIPEWEPSPLLDLRERLRDALAGAGMQEIITYSLTTNDVLARVIAPDALAAIRPLRLRNTLSADREVMRPTLRHAILETVERSLRAEADAVAIFEAARIFLPTHDGTLPEEREHVTGAVAGVEIDRWNRPTDRALDFFDAKGILDAAFAALRLSVTYEAGTEFGFTPNRVARLKIGATEIGVVGEVHPDTLAAFDIERPVVLFDIDVARLIEAAPERAAVRTVSRFPAVEQDLALVLDESVAAGAVVAIIEGSPLVASARVFDVFRGGRLAAGKKSVAFSIRYQTPNRTLTSEDANKEQARLLKRLEREFGAELRG
ncbi:MAG: phenylalanine--tRNA ligase subunit beta [Dehalococcoidia bacterium]|nr:phenylalanine--tRNA ligase subunit beta [Dehalococcoidia bacterium]